MDAEGGTKAVNNLHGKAISKNGKPLVVEPSYDVSADQLTFLACISINIFSSIILSREIDDPCTFLNCLLHQLSLYYTNYLTP